MSSGRAKQRVVRLSRVPLFSLLSSLVCFLVLCNSWKEREGYIPTSILYIFSIWIRQPTHTHTQTERRPVLSLSWTLNWRLAAAANSCDFLPDVVPLFISHINRLDYQNFTSFSLFFGKWRLYIHSSKQTFRCCLGRRPSDCTVFFPLSLSLLLSAH